MSGINLEDFLAEAEELIDRLNHGFLELDQQLKQGEKPEPSLVNDIFRSAHSLKGICGMFGFTEVGEIAHKMEDLLDRLRLQKLKLTPKTLDIMFQTTEELHKIMHRKASGEEISPSEVEALKKKLEQVEEVKEEDDKDYWLKESGLEPEILSVLTEYEEHRLIENLKEKKGIYRITVSFDLGTFDEELNALQGKLKQIGELITTLPSAEESNENRITFYLLLGSNLPQQEIEAELFGFPASISAVKSPPVPTLPKSTPEKKEEVKEAPGEELERVRSLTQTVRVSITKLDNLMNIVGELVLSKNIIAQLIERLRAELGFSELALELYKANRNLERKLQELQESVLEVRMVPIGQIYDKLRRNVRTLSRELGKEVDFITEGGETELDKLIIEDLADPLMHIIRNALDHGIEPREERIRLGKPPQGQIRLNAYQQGNHVVIEISDDGAGLNLEKIRQKAIERGLISPEEEVREEELVQVLFTPGFSTAEKVSEVSGRGVGLDVVKNNISALSGAIDIESSPGEGTKVIITLPITLAIIQALIVEAGGETFAIPLNSVSSGLAIRPEEIKTIEGREVIEQRERTLPLLRLDEFFRLNGRKRSEQEELYVVTVAIAERRLGLVVDKLLGRQDIVIKSIGEVLSGIKGIAGATELGDQRTILVLDVVGMIEEASSGLKASSRQVEKNVS